MTQPDLEKQSGMTMIEILITIFMVGALIVICAAVFNVSIMNRRMGQENVAYHIASNQLEQIRGTAYDSLPPSSSIVNSQLSQLPSGSGSYTISDYGGYTGLKELVVTVSWVDGGNRSVVLRTLIGTGGINP